MPGRSHSSAQNYSLCCWNGLSSVCRQRVLTCSFVSGHESLTAIHDATAAAMHQCRRLLIILSPEAKTEESTCICDNQSQVWYEQKVGLHDALTKNDPRVILVEIGKWFLIFQKSLATWILLSHGLYSSAFMPYLVMYNSLQASQTEILLPAFMLS